MNKIKYFVLVLAVYSVNLQANWFTDWWKKSGIEQQDNIKNYLTQQRMGLKMTRGAYQAVSDAAKKERQESLSLYKRHEKALLDEDYKNVQVWLDAANELDYQSKRHQSMAARYKDDIEWHLQSIKERKKEYARKYGAWYEGYGKFIHPDYIDTETEEE